MPKLLIVDDEIDVREFANNFFKRRKIEVFTAGTGEEVLDVVDKEKPDLVMKTCLKPGFGQSLLSDIGCRTRVT